MAFRDSTLAGDIEVRWDFISSGLLSLLKTVRKAKNGSPSVVFRTHPDQSWAESFEAAPPDWGLLRRFSFGFKWDRLCKIEVLQGDRSMAKEVRLTALSHGAG